MLLLDLLPPPLPPGLPFLARRYGLGEEHADGDHEAQSLQLASPAGLGGAAAKYERAGLVNMTANARSSHSQGPW